MGPIKYLIENKKELETIVRGALWPFESNSQWKKGNLDTEPNYSYDEMINFITNIASDHMEGNFNRKERRRWNKLGLSEENLFYNNTINNSVLTLKAPAFVLGSDSLVTGILDYDVQDPSLDIVQEAEPETMLFEIRKQERQIVEDHETDYLEVYDNIVPGDNGIFETLLTIEIPVDYDPEMVEKTVTSATSVSREMDNYFDDVSKSIPEY